jgi:methylglutaconyl-CoA hydratase
VAEAKSLIHEVTMRRFPEVNEYTARLIAEVRATTEAREGMAAFLEKRKPSWAQEA